LGHHGWVTTIVHLTSELAWQRASAAGELRADSLDQEGFIHCSTPDQIVDVATRFYDHQADLLLLYLEVDRVHAPVRWEPPAHPDGLASHDEHDLFPHVYGVINLDAVVDVVPLPLADDGGYRWPAGLG
jgi:uncharacterized protein (DUF952 family)